MRFWPFTLVLVVFACNPTTQKLDTHKQYSFLALGDSYTVGEAVAEEESWPMQLANRLQQDSIALNVQIVAETGWTTDELLSGIIKADIDKSFDLVSLLIGVNNQYRGLDEDQFEKEFKVLLDEAIKFANGNNHHVFVVSIPDYGVTDFVRKEGLDPIKISRELDSYNAIAQKISILRDVTFVNISPLSRKAVDDPTLIAADGLHPSGAMYGQWVELMYQQVYQNLSAR